MKRAGSLAESFRYAFAGLRYAFGSQRNIRIQSLIGLGAIAFGLWLGLSLVEWAILFLVIAFVLVTEMINTVFETIVDMITTDYNPLAKTAKDVGAAAVIAAAITAVAIGVLLFLPKLLALLR
ncbi:MAG: diacylglycerol kinase family protein [Chloroflexota bacterium]|nr:diacylglycerol kinase family protein [Dehalococcoidia bacterium]MDW8253453.1 diacylglycerol kinase family protein [Chloroflexota bacterium]